MGRSVVIYGDGSSIPNPGPGGWAIHIIEGADRQEFCGGSAKSTNNRMELTAMCEALRWALGNLGRGDRVEIRMDSQLALNSAFEWLEGWKKRNWRKASGEPILNPDLVTAIDQALTEIRRKGIVAHGTWVKGHASEPGNERVDELAGLEAKAWAAGKGVQFRKLNDALAHAAAPAPSPDPAPVESRIALIRIGRDLPHPHSGWSNALIVAEEVENGMWKLNQPVDTPLFHPDWIAEVHPLHDALIKASIPAGPEI
ncbi:ribonuclease H [Paracoccus litorisediminis]|uniref:ribonuclease H family protein n=1 Tax=Paracoccus litorisediminis TaxID=2006130 RepID=UPI003733E7D8